MAGEYCGSNIYHSSIKTLLIPITDFIQEGQSMTVALPSLFGAQGEPYYYYYHTHPGSPIRTESSIVMPVVAVGIEASSDDDEDPDDEVDNVEDVVEPD